MEWKSARLITEPRITDNTDEIVTIIASSVYPARLDISPPAVMDDTARRASFNMRSVDEINSDALI